jgi:Zn-dependent oligopeptidase
LTLDLLAPLSGYRFFSPSRDVQDASSKAVSLLSDYGVETSMRLDVFQAKLAAEKNMKTSGEWERLDSESRRLVEKMIVEGKRVGLALPEKEKDELKALRKELESLCIQFIDKYNQENVSTNWHESIFHFSTELIREQYPSLLLNWKGFQRMSSLGTRNESKKIKRCMMSLLRNLISSLS